MTLHIEARTCLYAKEHLLRFYFQDIPRAVEFEETERRKVLSAGCGREMQKCVTAAEFRFEMMKNF